MSSIANQNSAYSKIKDLSNKLRAETRVVQRRKIGEELKNLLTKSETRRQLAEESTPKCADSDDPSLNASKCIAMAQLFTMTIGAAIGSANKIRAGKSKAKLTDADILLPCKILLACVEPDETFDGGSLAIPKIPKKTVRAVLGYCLNMLADEEANEICERDLLEMLKHLCSRPEYVGFFHRKYFTVILDELSHRLTVERQRENPDVFSSAAGTLDFLFQTCRSLGIQMNPFVPDIVQMIADFCRIHISEESWKKSGAGASNLYNALASIFYSHPETSIGSIKRVGRPLVAFWKKTYSSKSGAEKDALNKFMLAYM